MQPLETISTEEAQKQWILFATLAIALLGTLHAFTLAIHPAAIFLVIIAQAFVTLSAVTAVYLHVSTKEAFEEFVSRTPLRGHEPLACFSIAAALTLVASGVLHYVSAIIALALAGLSLVWVYRHVAFGVVKRSTSLVVDAIVRVWTASDRNEVYSSVV